MLKKMYVLKYLLLIKKTVKTRKFSLYESNLNFYEKMCTDFNESKIKVVL